MRFAAESAALFCLMFSDLRLNPAVVPSAEAAYGVLTARFQIDSPGDAGLAARTLGIWSLMHGLAVLIIERQIDDQSLIEQIVTSVFDVF